MKVGMMNTNSAFEPYLLVFRGREVNASYNPQQLSIYQDNPLIEALPPLLTTEEAFVLLVASSCV